MVAESFQLKNYVFKQNQKMEKEIVKISGKQEAEEGGKQETSLECWAEIAQQPEEMEEMQRAPG